MYIDKDLRGKYSIQDLSEEDLRFFHEAIRVWKSHTNLTHPGKYFRPSKVKIMRPTSPK